MDSFFIVADQPCIDRCNNQDTAQSEPLKDQRKYITINILVKTPKTKNVKTPIKPDKIDELIAKLVAMKAFYMNEAFELKKRDCEVKRSFFKCGEKFF